VGTPTHTPAAVICRHPSAQACDAGGDGDEEGPVRGLWARKATSEQGLNSPHSRASPVTSTGHDSYLAQSPSLDLFAPSIEAESWLDDFAWCSQDRGGLRPILSPVLAVPAWDHGEKGHLN
jgi:hypothetical protein